MHSTPALARVRLHVHSVLNAVCTLQRALYFDFGIRFWKMRWIPNDKFLLHINSALCLPVLVQMYFLLIDLVSIRPEIH